jgi:FMN-dependent NADH-azoreductase
VSQFRQGHPGDRDGQPRRLYAPGTPKERYDHVQNHLRDTLAGMPALDVDFIVPALSMALSNLAMAELVPLFEASRDRALQEAASKARQLGE